MDNRRQVDAALVNGMLAAFERQVAADFCCPVVTGKYDNGVLSQAEFVQFFQDGGDIPIHGLHHCSISPFALIGDFGVNAFEVFIFCLQWRVDDVKWHITKERVIFVFSNKLNRMFGDQVLGVTGILGTIFAVVPPTHRAFSANRSPGKVISPAAIIDPRFIESVFINSQAADEFLVRHGFKSFLECPAIFGCVGVIAIVPLAEDAGSVSVGLEGLCNGGFFLGQFTADFRTSANPKRVTGGKQHGTRWGADAPAHEVVEPDALFEEPVNPRRRNTSAIDVDVTPAEVIGEQVNHVWFCCKACKWRQQQGGENGESVFDVSCFHFWNCFQFDTGQGFFSLGFTDNQAQMDLPSWPRALAGLPICAFQMASQNLPFSGMFDSLSSKLQRAFRNLRGLGTITETNVAESLREVRLALLEADVNFKVARDFVEQVKAKSLGQEVIQSVHPGQQIVKIIHDELVALLGSQSAGLNLEGKPACLMMVGLHGSGKTTSSAKLARLLQKQNRRPLLVAADVYRPAAMDQLAVLGEQIQTPVFIKKGETDVLRIAKEALDYATEQHLSPVIFDTAGRLQIDEPLVQELVRLRDAVKPSEILLVLDAATGQEAVNVATHFDKALGITGAILTKLDGDARGGAALSFKAVTGKPIKFAGIGEKLEDFEPFHPERMASRILGMGDVVSLVEKAAEAVTLEDAKRLEEKMRKGQFNLEDFLEQLRAMKKLGPLQNLMEMLPGGAEMVKQADLSKSEREFRRMEGMICAMTPEERRNPAILNARRRQRIAKGSGVTVTELNQMLNKFWQLQMTMKKFGKFQKMLARRGAPPPGMFR